MQTPIHFTDNAARKVWELLEEEGNFKLKLRVYVTGGGCSGFQYGFKFDEEVAVEDTLVTNENHPVQLIVDSISLQYLFGGQIDYQEDLEGARFIIRNPNAATTCGCGSSFSV